LVVNPVYDVIEVHKPKSMPVVPQFLLKPVFHRRFDLGLCVAVAYQNTLSLIDLARKLQTWNSYEKDLFELRTNLSPSRYCKVAAFCLIHPKNVTPAVFQKNCHILAVLLWTMPYLTIGWR